MELLSGSNIDFLPGDWSMIHRRIPVKPGLSTFALIHTTLAKYLYPSIISWSKIIYICHSLVANVNFREVIWTKTLMSLLCYHFKGRLTWPGDLQSQKLIYQNWYVMYQHMSIYIYIYMVSVSQFIYLEISKKITIYPLE